MNRLTQLAFSNKYKMFFVNVDWYGVISNVPQQEEI